jgi:hypothetical protein
VRAHANVRDNLSARCQDEVGVCAAQLGRRRSSGLSLLFWFLLLVRLLLDVWYTVSDTGIASTSHTGA